MVLQDMASYARPVSVQQTCTLIGERLRVRFLREEESNEAG